MPWVLTIAVLDNLLMSRQRRASDVVALLRYDVVEAAAGEGFASSLATLEVLFA